MLLAGEYYPDMVALTADLAESVRLEFFREKFPERFFELGIAEQNMAAVASGMAAMGKIPVIASYAVFSPGRNWEQIRTTICYNDRHVVIVGSHAGLSVGPDGGSHQALEDIALTRVLPRMTVFSPSDSIETKKALLAAMEIDGPVYIRLSRDKTPIMTTEETPFEVGRGRIVFGSDENTDRLSHSVDQVGIIATGPILANAIKAAEILKKQNIQAKILNISTIKPLDEETVVKIAEECEAIVTIEEHQIAGGLGSAIAELLAQKLPTPIEFVGVRDSFGQSGTSAELFDHYGLSESVIVSAAKRAIGRKRIWSIE